MTVQSGARPGVPDLAALLGPDVQRSPDMEAVWTWLIEQDGSVPNWLRLPPAEARALQDGLAARWNAVLPDVASVEAHRVPGPAPIDCQLITPDDPRPGCILFLHGGGWSFGNLRTYERFMRLLAIATRRRVLAPDYRLAPEHPYPVPFEDCRAAWQWLVAHKDAIAGGGALIMAGDSAGANLCTAVMLDAGDQGGAMPDAALLFYGVFSPDLDSPSYRRFAEGFGLTRAMMSRFWDFYAPDTAARQVPLLCPVEASDEQLGRLPPLYLNAAGLDPLLCDSTALSARLSQAGVDHELRIHPGVHHGFMQMSLRLPEAQVAIEAAAAFLDAHA